MRVAILAVLFMFVGLVGCTNVDVTKTGKGIEKPTDPNNVEVLMTKPDKSYIELGTVTANGFDVSDTASMHNALRANAAPLGADAVIIISSGQIPGSFGSMKVWANAVAIKWQAK
jgi:hypothetical protein